jgi:hypothetical protein
MAIWTERASAEIFNADRAALICADEPAMNGVAFSAAATKLTTR